MDDNNKQILPRKEAEDASTETLPEKESIPSYSKSYSRTQLETIKFDYTWEINRFTDLVMAMKTLTSAPFPETVQCNIRMDSVRENHENILRLYVCAKTEFLGSCKVSSIQSIYLGGITECFKSSSVTLLCEIREQRLHQCLCNDDTLTLTFQFEIFHKLRTNTIYENIIPSSAIFSEDQTSENSILHDSKSDDIKSIQIIINKESYTVPKDLLDATNSAYFKALCNIRKEIDMTDELIANDELEDFKVMLSFITTGTNPNFYHTSEYYMRLLKVAHKYDVCDFKLICERHLVDRITLKNAVEIIQLAFSCDAKFLEKYALSFIKFHMKKIANTKEFRSLPQEYLEKIMKPIEISKTSELCVVESVTSFPSLFLW